MYEEDEDPVFPYLMRALDSNDKSALFVASHHNHSWESLPKWFQTQVLSRTIGVFECAADTDRREVLQSFSKKTLESSHPDIFLTPDKSWTISSTHDLFQSKYSEIAKKMEQEGYDYSYLNNISSLCPGFLAYLNMNFASNATANDESMDSSIRSIFKAQNKQLVSLENREIDDWKVYSITKARYWDVRADFNYYQLKSFIQQLGNLKEEEEAKEKQKRAVVKENEEERDSKEARPLPTFEEEVKRLEQIYYDSENGHSIVIFDEATNRRNVLWMPKILEAVSKDSAVIVAGDAHYVGPKGIFSLGHKAGLQWQYYCPETDTWKTFIYEPSPAPTKKDCTIS